MSKKETPAADIAAETAPALIGQATEAQIDAWKRKHTNIFAIEADGHVAYFKSPDRQTIGMAMSLSNGGSDGMKFNNLLFDNCWLGGSEEIKTSDRLYLPASAHMRQMIDVAEAQIKKL